MDLRSLQTFLVCAEHQNFTRAAAELAYVQSTVTAQVKALERELEVPLFDRVGRGVELTAAGERLQGYARRIVALVDEARAVVSFEGSEPHGDLMISATETLSTFRLPEVLVAFQDRYPDVRLFLHPHDPQTLIERVLGNDAAITLDAPVVHPELDVTVLREEPVVLLAPPGHVLEGHAGLDAEDLRSFRFLLSELDVSYGGLFLDTLAAQRVSPVAVMEFASVAAIKMCVRTGLGLTVLPRFACEEELASGDLVLLDFPCPSVYVQTVVHRDRWVPPAARALLDMAEEMLRTT